MSFKYWILIMFGICSRSSAKFCSRSYVGGKWISEGDCGGSDMMSDIMSELGDRARKEEIKPTEKPTEEATVSLFCNLSKMSFVTQGASSVQDEQDFRVFQRRVRGDVDFYRIWTDYVEGFGNSEGDYWLGLEELHNRTTDANMELEINMITKTTGIYMVAKYSSFRIGPASDKYRLHVSGFSGNATFDALAWHNEQQFSTKDADHDGVKVNCASDLEGGWWYSWCAHSNLNGNFNKTHDKGIWWYDDVDGDGGWDTSHFLRFSEMKFRKRA